jgi:hypothetical protein
MQWAGYQHLIWTHSLPVPAPRLPAEVRPVTKIVRSDDTFLVPQHVMRSESRQQPSSMDHLLWAIRYEGVNLAVIDALARAGILTAGQVRAAVVEQPNSAFARRLGYGWELITGQEIPDIPAPGGAYVPLFDPELFVTGRVSSRTAKWRVEFNGLGTARYCPTVRRTAQLANLLRSDVFGRAREFADQARARGLLERILSWAYLAETRSSYEIEHEAAPQDKAEAFAKLLQEAHQGADLSEAYLTSLQNAAMTNPLSREPSYRVQQNWLARGGLGALAVRYVPPAPEPMVRLMEDFCASANASNAQDALMQASVNSFGFVYLHPFMDGNGRLSRFLFHHALCRAKALPDGFILPMSVAILHDEAGYLAALESFSKPVRQLWAVRWIDGANYTFDQRCADAVYRYWDATEQATFSARMAQRAVQVHLVQEGDFLLAFDRAFQTLDRQLELPSATLHELIIFAQRNGGTLSNNRRHQYRDKAPAAYFDTIEREVQEAFGLGAHQPPATPERPPGG